MRVFVLLLPVFFLFAQPAPASDTLASSRDHAGEGHHHGEHQKRQDHRGNANGVTASVR
jgi:hypothetical protein